MVPLGESEFFFVSCLNQVDEFTFHNMLLLTVKVLSVHILIILDDLSKEGSLYGFYKGMP